MKSKKILFLTILVMAGMFFSGLTVNAAKAIKAPEISKFVTTKNSVKISWKTAKNKSVSYVYRKDTTGEYKKIATLASDIKTYTDKNVTKNNRYSYKIAEKVGKKTYWSKVRNVTPIEIAAPKLNYLKTYSKGKTTFAKLQWTAKKGETYYVYRKEVGGSWKKITQLKAETQLAHYTDSFLKPNTEYTYTCKVVKKIGKILYKYGNYEAGITTLREKPNVTADCQNLKATLNWDAVPRANVYKIYRKTTLTGSYKLIGETDSTNYTDYYVNSVVKAADKKYLCANTFVDPSVNPFVYTVRAVKTTETNESYSDYLIDGDFHIETPSIVSIDKPTESTARYEWSNLPNAKEYLLYSGYINDEGLLRWKRTGTVKRNSNSTRLSATVKVDSTHTFFTVKAKFIKNGKTVYSAYDKGFDIANRQYQTNNILFLGDSITFGSPYKGETTKEVFSYPWRVQQLTGVQMYNPSIPGATYAYNERTNRHRLIVDVAEKILRGKTPTDALHPNSQTFKDFDVVVLAAGTNDYSDNTVFGDLNSTNIREFNGAVNQIMKWIEMGNEQRVAEGLAPTKVVFVEMFYSDRTKQYTELTNRFETKNDIGLTLTDYQNNYNQLIDKYEDEGFDIYRFDTTEFVDSDSCPYVTSDNLHMSRYTYTQIGNAMTKFLIENNIITKKGK